MPPSPTPLFTHSELTLRLRAAGCVFAEEEARLLIATARNHEELDTLAELRTAGQPLEHLLGWAEFCGRRITVGPGVFVPRRRTAFLARQAAALTRPGAVVVDLCCGSGAVGAVLAGWRDIELYAADIDPLAVAYAERNIAPDGGHALVGDLYEALPDTLRGRVDVLAANAPYVPSDAIGLMPPEARLFEPLAALDGGVDGLAVQRRIAAGAPGWLAPGGHLLIETSSRQAPETAAAMHDAGLIPQVLRSAELDATVVVGTIPETLPT